MKIMIFSGTEKDPGFREQMENGSDLVLAQSFEGKSMCIPGVGYRIYFRRPSEKIAVHEQLEKFGWAVWGYNSYLLAGIPIEVVLSQLRKIFPSATFLT